MRIVVVTLCAAVVVFCAVQGQVTAEGAGRYVALQRSASQGSAVRVDIVMREAVRDSVKQAAAWSVLVTAVGLVSVALFWCAALAARRRKAVKAFRETGGRRG